MPNASVRPLERMTNPAIIRSNAAFLLSRNAVLDDSGESAQHFGDPAAELAAFSGGTALVDRHASSSIVQHGTDALDLVHRLSTNDLLQLAPGHSAFSVLTSERGRIIDVLNVAMIEKDRFLLLSESPDSSPAIDWIDRFTIIEDSTVRDVSGEVTRLALIGTATYALTGTAFGTQLVRGEAKSLNGLHEGIVLVASTWGDFQRVDLVMPVGRLEQVWDSLTDVGAVPTGNLAFHAARVDQGVPFPGSELNEGANPLEAGLKNLISFTKGCYVGQEVVARLDTYDKLQKRLMTLQSDGPLSPGARLSADGKRAGLVTSVSSLKTSREHHALGYVRREFWSEGTTLNCGSATVTVKSLRSVSLLA